MTSSAASSPTPTTGFSPAQARRGAVVVFAVFLLHGFMTGSWVARLPTVRGDLALAPSAVGLVLLLGSLGNLTSMPVAGAVIQRFGTRRALVVASAWYAVFIVAGTVLVTRGSAVGLAVCLYLAQAGSGVWTTSFNAASGRAEHAVGRPIISRFHAGWSLGTVLAASLTTALAHAGVGLVAHLAGVAALVLLANGVLTAWLLPDASLADRIERLERALEPGHPGADGAAGLGPEGTAAGVVGNAGTGDERDGAGGGAASGTDEPVASAGVTGAGTGGSAVGHRAGREERPVRLPSAAAAWRERRTVLVGMLLLACGLAEGSANDWIALGVTDDFGHGTNTALGTTALTVFVAFMMLTRALGTGVIARLGRVRTMRISLVAASTGLVVFGLSPWLPAALAAVALWAMGTAMAFPLGMSAVSEDPVWATVRVAVVSTIAYGSSLAGPPLLGLVADWIGYRHALLLIVLVLVPSLWIVHVLAPQDGAEPGARG